MRFVFPLLVAMSAIALVGAARPDSGHPAVQYTPPPSDPNAIRIMATYAQCVAVRDPRGAQQMLAADYRTDAYKKAIREFARSHRDCLPGGQLKFNQVVFAGDMAEALLKHDGLDSAQLAGVAAADQAPGLPRCVIRKRPADVAALLETPHASRAEADAVANLQGAIAACTAKNVTMTANIVGFRAGMALATYRLMNNPAHAPAGN